MGTYPEDKEAQQSLKKKKTVKKVLMVKSQVRVGGTLQVKNF